MPSLPAARGRPDRRRRRLRGRVPRALPGDGDPLEAAAFAACAASCAVEGVGTTSLGDREEVLRRMALRERMIETGEWDE